MVELISKLQYKNYERGEFSDEKERTIDETITLIENFPWDTQRGVTIEVTCPSVTIYSQYYGYLKIAIYFNGKFIAYYLDNEKHLYEHPLKDLQEVQKVVKQFFEQNLDFAKFEKKTFSFGAVKDFENGSFEYSTNITRFFFHGLMLLYLAGIASAGTFAMFTKSTPTLIIPIWTCLDITVVYTLYSSVRVYLKAKNIKFYISKGHNGFEIWRSGTLEKYDKSNVASITTYNAYSRASRILKVMEINFKDESKITIPALLIEPLTFIGKFPDTPKNDFAGTFLTSKIVWKYLNN